MSDYIEREAAKLRIFEYGVKHRDNANIASACENLERQISAIPAADVRPVVFCRDCKYNRGTKTWIDNDVTDDCTNGHGYPPLDWFCADGEKREES